MSQCVSVCEGVGVPGTVRAPDHAYSMRWGNQTMSVDWDAAWVLGKGHIIFSPLLNKGVYSLPLSDF